MLELLSGIITVLGVVIAFWLAIVSIYMYMNRKRKVSFIGRTIEQVNDLLKRVKRQEKAETHASDYIGWILTTKEEKEAFDQAMQEVSAEWDEWKEKLGIGEILSRTKDEAHKPKKHELPRVERRYDVDIEKERKGYSSSTLYGFRHPVRNESIGPELSVPRYYDAQNFSEGVAWVKVNEGYIDQVWRLIDEYGKPVFEHKGNEPNSYSGLLSSVIEGYPRKYTFMDMTGKKICIAEWDFVTPFKNGYSIVANQKECGYLDTQGKLHKTRPSNF